MNLSTVPETQSSDYPQLSATAANCRSPPLNRIPVNDRIEINYPSSADRFFSQSPHWRTKAGVLCQCLASTFIHLLQLFLPISDNYNLDDLVTFPLLWFR